MSYVLQIRKKTQNEMLILLALGIFFCFGLFFDLLGLPGVLKYSIDVLWLLLLVTIAMNHFKMPNVETHQLFRHVILFWLITLVGFALNTDSPLYYMWGFRNTFRFYVFFFACVMFLR